MKVFNFISSVVYVIGKKIRPQKCCFNYEAVFVYEQLNNLPWYMKFPFIIICLIIDTGFLCFHKKNFDQRSKILLKLSHLSILFDFFRFFYSLTIFALFSLDQKEQHENS